MLFSSALVSSFLFAPAVFADGQQHHGHRHSEVLNRLEQSTNVASSERVIYSGNWVGALLTGDSKTFTAVNGTVEAPPVPHLRNSSFSILVGIDGDSCTNVTLQAGISFQPPDGEEDGHYQAWCEWYPGPMYEFPHFDISQGDIVKLSAVAMSANTGTAIIENVTKGQNVTKQLSHSQPLCMQDAVWIVNEFVSPYTDFRKVKFVNASAIGGDSETYGPARATPIDLVYNGKTMAGASTNEHSVFITYGEH